MSDDHARNPTTAYYVISGIFLTWNIIGLMLYYQQMTMTPEMLASFDPVKAAFIQATPVWANAAYATAVTFGVIASLLLLLRHKLAFGAFVVSFIGIVLQDLESFVVRDVIAVFGNEAFIIPPIVFVIALIEIGYAKSVANRYYR
tara:strand:- start:5578 stop:6012 length:435 start_codon:yes stop_codon:yes gene_type:complete